ncbi:hypothetical protein QAD02_013705 [Eretmocerus hayati]|uniref:Uncharacterized protein n=1 Tax=Eretmocerus hayati TaxID=131215 RepID=A0ACC2P379_9HYME|nr:hypothetical protein QAD02_013705 [Eretmocerus hayati]
MELWWISKTITNRVVMVMDEPAITATVEVLRRFGNQTEFPIIPEPYSRIVKIQATYKCLKARKAFERFLETTGGSSYTWEFRNIPNPKGDAHRLTIHENLTLQQHEQSSDDEINVGPAEDLVPPTIEPINIDNSEYENPKERNHQVLSARTGSLNKTVAELRSHIQVGESESQSLQFNQIQIH